MADELSIIEQVLSDAELRKQISSQFFSILNLLFGGLIGFLAGYFTNRQKLRHESKEREKDRDHQLLKEAYINAYQAIQEECFKIADFSPPSLDSGRNRSDDNIINFNDSLIEIVGSQATNKAKFDLDLCANNILLEFEQMYWDIFIFVDLDNKLQGLITTYNNLSDKIGDLIEKELDKGEDTSYDYIEGLRNLKDEYDDKLMNYHSEAMEISRKLTLKTQEFDAYKNERILDLYKASFELCEEMRKDLNRSTLSHDDDFHDALTNNYDELLVIAKKRSDIRKEAVKRTQQNTLEDFDNLKSEELIS